MVDEYDKVLQLINHPLNIINNNFERHQLRFSGVQIYMIFISHNL